MGLREIWQLLVPEQLIAALSRALPLDCMLKYTGPPIAVTVTFCTGGSEPLVTALKATWVVDRENVTV